MVIKEVNINNFGKLHHLKLSFQSGFNLICGNNEAGKTTLHTFIRGMLFGIEKQRGRSSKNDTYSRYEPWENPNYYEGSMRIEMQGIPYRIERNFQKNNKSLRVIREDTGKILNDNERLGLFQGFDEAGYYNTLSIGQLGSATDSELELLLRNYAANLTTTKNAELNVKNALLTLKSERRKTEQKLIHGTVDILEKQIQKFEQEILILEEEQEALRKEQDLLRDKKERLDGRRKLLQHSESLYEKRIYVEQEIEQLDNQIMDGRFQVNADMEILTRNGIQQVDDVIHRLARLEQKREKNRNLMGNPWIFILAFAGVMSAIVKVWPVLVTIAGCMAILLIYLMRRKNQKEKRIQIEREELITWKELCFRMRETEVFLRDLESRLKVKYAELDTLRMNSLSPEESRELKEAIAECEENLQKTAWKLEQKSNHEAELQKEAERVQTYLNEARLITDEIKAIDMAANKIDELAVSIQGTVGSRLNELASGYIENITGGKYTRLFLDEKMNITVSDGEHFIPLDQLSKGTIEQMYLSLRLAAADILYPGEFPPVLLDDTFVLYDNERLEHTLQALRFKDRQILLFTCSSREKDIVEQFQTDYHSIMI